MPKLPILRPQEVIKALERAGLCGFANVVVIFVLGKAISLSLFQSIRATFLPLFFARFCARRK